MNLAPNRIIFVACAWLAWKPGQLPAQQVQPPRDYPGIPQVTGLSPRGWHRGATVEVEFTGTRLHEPRGVLVLTTDKIKTVKVQATSADAKPESRGKTARATLEIAPDCPVGQHVVRLFTNYGLGDLAVFSVSPLTSIPEAEPLTAKEDLNGKPETAEVVQMDCTINGILNGPEFDTFKVEAKGGELFSAEIECYRLAPAETEDGSEVLLTVRDAAGKTLAACDDTALFLSDPYVSFKSPANGPLLVTVQPMLPLDRSRRIPYRLHVGKFLRPAGLFPAGGSPGGVVSGNLLGLPEGASSSFEKPIPAETPAGPFMFLASEQTPSPNMLRVFSGANIPEKEPNSEASQATTAPSNDGPTRVAFDGILEQAGDVDTFKFRAKKGERLLVASYGQALGSPVDLQLSVLPVDAKPGQNPDKADDSNDGDLNLFDSGTIREKLDPRMIFSPKQDGDFILAVRDSRNLGSTTSAYRVEISPVEPGVAFSLFAQDNNARQVRNSIAVGCGNRTLAFLNLRPLYGTEKLEGDLVLKSSNLPAGVTLASQPFSADQRRIPVLFEATADAAVGATALELHIEPADPAKTGPFHSQFRHTLGIVYQGNDYTQSITVDRLSFAVTDEVPFKVTATPPSVPLSRNSELTIEVNLERHADYKEPVEILVEAPPQGVSPQPGVFLTKDQTKATLRLSAEGGAALGKRQITVTARSKGDGRVGRMYSSTDFFPLEIADPFLRVKLARTAVERGKKAQVTASVEHLRPLPGKATATLIRLPKGLTVVGGPIDLPAGADKITFQIEASTDALVGSYPAVACEVTVQADGRELRQVTGYGLMRVDPSRSAPAN